MNRNNHHNQVDTDPAKPCAFIMHVREPLLTMGELCRFFTDRNIAVDTFQMNNAKNGHAMLIVHCHLEKDRMPRTVLLLEKFPGILQLERMEGK